MNKDAKQLAKRVKKEGYDCEYDGHVFKVSRDGTLLAQFSGGASYGGLAAIRAETDLRRLGILPRRKDKVATRVGGIQTLSEEERVALSNRISEAISGLKTNIPGLARVIHKIAADMDIMWSESAIEQSIRATLKGKGMAAEVGQRWNTVLDVMNGKTIDEAFITKPAPAPAVNQDDEVATLQELLAEAERERDVKAKKLSEAEEINARINRDRHVLAEKVKILEERPEIGLKERLILAFVTQNQEDFLNAVKEVN